MTEATLAGVLLTIAGLQIKHFICDGPLQTLAMVKAKRHYGRPLGLAHALIHGAGTFAVLAFVAGPSLALALAALDSAIHYHVDFTKEQTIARCGWTTSDGWFWWAFTADQTLHHMTYLLLGYLAFTL